MMRLASNYFVSAGKGAAWAGPFAPRLDRLVAAGVPLARPVLAGLARTLGFSLQRGVLLNK